MRLRSIALLLATGIAATSAQAQQNFAAGSTAAPWLKLPNSARLAALGEAGSALSGDVDLQTLNPASLAGLKGQNLSLMHNAYVQDSAIEHAAYGLNLMENAGLAVSVDYLSFGSVDKYKVVNNALVADGSFTPTGLTGSIGFGQSFGALSAGVNAKYISQNLAGDAAASFAGDLGLQYGKKESGYHYGLGVALLNLGGQLEGAELPRSWKVGLQSGIEMDAERAINLAIDFNALQAEGNFGSGSAGLEYVGGSLYSLRGGYKFAGNGSVGGFSAGAGLRYSVFNVDYAFVSRDFLGASNQVSLGAKF